MKILKDKWKIWINDGHHSWKVKWAPESLPKAWEIYVDNEYKTLAVRESEIREILDRYGAPTEVVAGIMENVPWGS